MGLGDHRAGSTAEGRSHMVGRGPEEAWFWGTKCSFSRKEIEVRSREEVFRFGHGQTVHRHPEWWVHCDRGRDVTVLRL